jgi:hypothetical protein
MRSLDLTENLEHDVSHAECDLGTPSPYMHFSNFEKADTRVWSGDGSMAELSLRPFELDQRLS